MKRESMKHGKYEGNKYEMRIILKIYTLIKYTININDAKFCGPWTTTFLYPVNALSFISLKNCPGNAYKEILAWVKSTVLPLTAVGPGLQPCSFLSIFYIFLIRLFFHVRHASQIIRQIDNKIANNFRMSFINLF